MQKMYRKNARDLTHKDFQMNLQGIKKRYEDLLDPDVEHIHIATEDYKWLIAEVEKLEEIETDLNNTIGFMQMGIDDWKAKAEQNHIPDATKKVSESKPVCVWTKWVEDGQEYWETSCDKLWTFNEGGPKDNGRESCCFCGLELEESE